MTARDLATRDAGLSQSGENTHRAGLALARIRVERVTTPAATRAETLENVDAGAARLRGYDNEPTAVVGRARALMHWDAFATVSAPFASPSVVHTPEAALARALSARSAAHTSRGTDASSTFYSTGSLASPRAGDALTVPQQDWLPPSQRAGPSVATALSETRSSGAADAPAGVPASPRTLPAGSPRAAARDLTAAHTPGRFVDMSDERTMHVLTLRAVAAEKAASAAAAGRRVAADAAPPTDASFVAARTRAPPKPVTHDFSSEPSSSVQRSAPPSPSVRRQESRAVLGLPPAWVAYTASAESTAEMFAPQAESLRASGHRASAEHTREVRTPTASPRSVKPHGSAMLNSTGSMLHGRPSYSSGSGSVWGAPLEGFRNDASMLSAMGGDTPRSARTSAQLGAAQPSLHIQIPRTASDESANAPMQRPPTQSSTLERSAALSRDSQLHAPPLERTARSVTLRDAPPNERTASRTLRTSHSGAAHGAVAEPHAAGIAQRLTSVWSAYMAGSLRLAAQPGTTSDALRPTQMWDSPATRTDSARQGVHPSGPHATRGAPPPGAASAAAVAAVPFFVGLSEDDVVAGGCEVVRLGAVRVGTDYAYAFKVRNPTPFSRRFRVVAAGWDDTPAAPRATMHVRFKALAIAPGLSATMTMIFRVSEPGVVAGGFSVESDDGVRLHARVVVHAIEPVLFDRTRAAVAAAGSLEPLADVATRLEQNAATWDAEYARLGAIDARNGALPAPNPTLKGLRAEEWGWGPPKTPSLKDAAIATTAASTSVESDTGGSGVDDWSADASVLQATSSRAASARTALLAITARGGGSGPWGDENAYADMATTGLGAGAHADADSAALASSQYYDALTRAPAAAIVGIAKDSGTTPGALLDATIKAQTGAGGAMSTLDVIGSALEPVDAIVIDNKPIFPHLANMDRLPFVPNVSAHAGEPIVQYVWA